MSRSSIVKPWNPQRIAAISYIAICLCILAGGWLASPDYPVRVISGEFSVGTWLSDMMLITLAILSMLLCMSKRVFPWVLFALFFLVLSLDERFMYHEHCKERLLILMREMPHVWQMLAELPVMLGGLLGAFVSVVLWRNISLRSGRILLILAVVCGTGSVVIDLLKCGVLWEDMLKLLAELCLVCAFIGLVPLHDSLAVSADEHHRNS